MRQATARARWMDVADVPQTEGWAASQPRVQGLSLLERWSPEQFARDQIRHLVRRIFFAPGSKVRQVAFSPIDTQADTAPVCSLVGHELSGSTDSDVAVVGCERSIERVEDQNGVIRATEVEQSDATHPRPNLWLMPANAGSDWQLGSAMRTYLEDIRREFGYSIVRTPCLSASEEAWALADWADGLVLVISAQRTRRAAALKIREMLTEARVRVLGAVLSEREFPVPEKIYRRL